MPRPGSSEAVEDAEQGLVADVERRRRPRVAAGQPAEELQGVARQEDVPDTGEDEERDRPDDRGAPLAGEEGEHPEEHRRQLDRAGEADQPALGALPPDRGTGPARQQVGDDERHEEGVDLAVAEGRADRLDGHDGDGADQREPPPAGHPAAPQHRLRRPDPGERPGDLPEHVRPEGEGGHQHRRDRRVDEEEVPARRAREEDVLADEHVLDRVHVDLEVDRVRQPWPPAAVGDDEGQQEQRHDGRRADLDEQQPGASAAGQRDGLRRQGDRARGGHGRAPVSSCQTASSSAAGTSVGSTRLANPARSA